MFYQHAKASHISLKSSYFETLADKWLVSSQWKTILFIYQTLIGPNSALWGSFGRLFELKLSNRKVNLSKMLIKFEYRLPLCWSQSRCEKNYLRSVGLYPLLFDIVEHQNKLYHMKSSRVENHQILPRLYLISSAPISWFVSFHHKTSCK